jgi:hypothetical protein
MPEPPVESISLADLAKELGAKADRLPPLVLEGYLHLVKSGCYAEDTFVERPAAGAREWLRTMFAPLKQRPMLPIKDVARFLEMSLLELRRWCLHFNIPIYMDTAFGELLSLKSFYSLQNGFFEIRNPLRTDRQALLVLFSFVKRISRHERVQLRRYDHRLEEELKRIVALPEPQRTIQATLFWSNYRDAKTIAECIFHTKRIPSHRMKEFDRKAKVIDASLNKKKMRRKSWNLRSHYLKVPRGDQPLPPVIETENGEQAHDASASAS